MNTQSMAQSFKEKQLSFERVATAYQEKWDNLQRLIQQKGVNPTQFHLFLRAFKTEKRLELWIKNSHDTSYQLLKNYTIVTSSGNLGPKRREGDLQVPEGFYHIDRFNPVSSFYLSLGINYPNESDSILGNHPLGGDIFIHGSDVTVGCLPLTDDKIKEVYMLAVQAKNSGQEKIFVHIFPFELTKNNISKHQENKNYDFWLNLVDGYAFFEQHRRIPIINITQNGAYKLTK
jgi:murein L,D-transpeptidase YafK